MKAFRRAAAAAALAAFVGGACTFSRDVTVRSHLLMKPLPQGWVNSFNLEERLKLGYVPEVAAFLASTADKGVERTRTLKVLGQALLEKGDARAAVPLLERAFAEEGRFSERGQVAWLLAQAHYWLDDFSESARWVEVARSHGLILPDGWLAFLRSAGPEPIYGGAVAGTRINELMAFSKPRVPRVTVKVNDVESEQMVFDTGASISLLTESAARRLGIEVVPGAKAGAYGLHRVEIEMGFGWAKNVRIGTAILTHVPFGILPDGALTFGSEASGQVRFDGVLGADLLKEFDWSLRYQERRILGVRLEKGLRRGSPNQNLFFRRLKPMVRASLNQTPWFLFLLDTGSEPTIVTRSGLMRAPTKGSEASYPMTLEGIGKSRVSWGKLSNVTVGVEKYMVQFADIVVKEDAEGLEDGILGSSFLANFDVTVRFSTMTVSLDRPLDRFLKAQELQETGAPIVPPSLF